MPRIVFDSFRKHFDVSLMVLGSLVKIFFGPRVQFVQPWIFKLHFSCAVVFLVRSMSLTHTHGVAVFWQNFSLNLVSISGAYTKFFYKVVVFFSLDFFLGNDKKPFVIRLFLWISQFFCCVHIQNSLYRLFETDAILLQINQM